MAFCKKCGKELPEGANNCPNCGESVGFDASAAINNLTNTADTTSAFDPRDIADNKVMAVLAYFGLLFLIPLLAAKQSPFARYHTNQGIVLFLVDIAVGIVGGILAFIPIIGWLVSSLASLVLFILFIIGIINAAQGKAKELPFIGRFRILK